MQGSREGGLREVVAVWSLFALAAAEVFCTYARIPVRELYHVSGSGPAAGAGRALVFLNFPTALAALALLLVVADRLPGRVFRWAANAYQDPKYERVVDVLKKSGGSERLDLLYPSKLPESK